jgi:hypothetical protein
MSHRAGSLGPRIARVLRWDFWPAWLFYAPVAVWVGLLSLRYRGVTTITASNPGMEDGGVVGESKFEILRKLPARYRIPTIKCGPDARVDEVCATIAANGWSWPLVAKPDVGQRGVGVCLVRNRGDLHRYLSSMAGDVILQPYHPGPFEAGVFYARFPGEERGRILSITDKHFPVVIGDGRSTLTELIDAHSRYRLQRDLFLRRHRSIAGSVLPPGVRLQLAVAGNHAQGTTFYDGWHLWTPALEDTIDSIARAVDGFYVGRFDVRYGDVDAFRSGRDVAVVELNGATAEFTNIYDPGTSLWAAYRTLFRQWSLVFAIGAANRRLGARASSLQRLVRLVTTHVSTPAVGVLSD